MNGAESYFEDLLMRVIEGIATEDEFATFSEIIRIDAELRRRYAREMRLHALLSCQGEAKTFDKDVPPCAAGPKRGWTEMSVGGRRGLNCWWKVAAAAAVLVSGAAVWHMANISSTCERFGTEIKAQTEPVLPAVWLVSQKGVKGLDLPATVPGTLRIESGEVVVRLDTGVELTLIGPASVAIESGIRVGLDQGRLLANVPHWATGFTVRTRELEIYDLGTVFGVQAGEAASDVFVFKGRVQVNEAGYGEWGRETTGAEVGICQAGEGVRAEAGERPVKFAANRPAAQKLFAAVKGGQSLQDSQKALKVATEIANLWAERYMPGSSFVAKMGAGVKFQKTAWVRPFAPEVSQQGANAVSSAKGGNMKTASVAALALATAMGAEMAGATSASVLVDTSPAHNRRWSTVYTNEVPLMWNWQTNASMARLSIEGMNGSTVTNFAAETTNWTWRVFATSVPAAEDAYALTLTFYSGGGGVVGALTSRLAVVNGAFGKGFVDPDPSSAAWSKVKDNSVIPYDAGWAEATAPAVASRLVIAQADGRTVQTNALPDAAGYIGWKLKKNGWGYGTFNLSLTFPGTVGEWDATLIRPLDGTLIRMQ